MSGVIETSWKSIDEIAEITGLARRSIYNWLRDGKLRYRRVVGGSIRIDPGSIWVDDTGPRTPWVVEEEKAARSRKNAAKGHRTRRSRAA